MNVVFEVGPVATSEGGASSADDADLAVLVDRLAAAGTDRATAMAREQVLRSVGAGTAPPGLRRLAEGLAASVGDLPRQRHPTEDAASVVTAVRGTALVVLEDFGPDAVAGAVAALVADGRRVLVTADRPAELASVRGILPPAVAARTLNRVPAISPAELRRLRGLIATSTPGRRARRGQQIPAESEVPEVAAVAELCRRAARPSLGRTGAGAIAGVLANADPERVTAVTSVARCVTRTLGLLPPRAERPWARRVLSDLIHSRHRAVFDRMLEDTAQAAAAVDRARGSATVTVVGPLPASAGEILQRYLAFLEAGGRWRNYFRSGVQRDAEPILDAVRIEGAVPESVNHIQLVLEHVDLAVRVARIDVGCAELGIPAPRHAGDVEDIADVLVTVAAASRSVGALRHDVLFLHESSPVAVPDLETVEQVAAAILEYAEFGSAAEAGQALDRAAADLAARVRARPTAPEHGMAVAALRDHDADAYAGAVERLVAARREAWDERCTVELLSALRSWHPGLAAVWEDAAGEGGLAPLGLACFLPLENLLNSLPHPDATDVVVVLGAARLGVERLLVTAAAPRVVAAVGPGERPGASPGFLSVLQRASALVVRNRAAPETDARVVALASGPRSASGPGRGGGVVEQAGA